MAAKVRIGLLTSGGDCPGLNAAIRGVARASYHLFDAQIIGIADGYRGLMEGEWREMEREEFSDILTRGGTILGTSRQPYRSIVSSMEEDREDKVSRMKKNYKKMKLDALVTLGGNGTHKTTYLLSQEGLNVIGLPKTIDNDIYGTEICFGFHSALEIATEVIDRIHTTADSHGRIMVIELMGNKAGWLTLYAGIGGGADVILLPEVPYDIGKVVQAITERREAGKRFTIIAVAEGAMSREEAAMAKKEFRASRETMQYSSIAYRVASEISRRIEGETRVVVPGHIQRGGSPSPYDRVLATRFGAFAAELIHQESFGKTVALVADKVVANKLSDIAGITKLVPQDHEIIKVGENMGVCFGR